MRRKRILFICGSINQTSQMHKIAEELGEFDCRFTTYYGDALLEAARRLRLTETTVLGYKLSRRARQYLERHNLRIDDRGRDAPYDLVVTCSDQVIPKNIRRTPVVLVQEGMTDPEGFFFHLRRVLPFVPRWVAGTSTNGLSGAYTLFCVASEGYKEFFVKKGADPARIDVTGIPNFDDCGRFLDNTFPHRHFVLACTSDSRETFGFENRRRFIERAVEIAGSRTLIFKLHPNENVRRAVYEIYRHAPEALVYPDGNAEEMIANCDVLITRYSSTAYVGLALGKEVHSSFDVDLLRRLTPIQNGRAAREIAGRCRTLVEPPHSLERGIQAVPVDLELAG